MVIEVRVLVTFEGHQLGDREREPSGELEMVYILIWVVDTWAHIYVEIHQTEDINAQVFRGEE